jgi:predicted acyltransferase
MTSGPRRERLLSLDVFRGATIAAMILVNDAGDYDHTYWPLLHARWHGWTPTDLIFPFFLFMVGMSLTFSHRLEFRPALWRAVKLFGLGLLVNFCTGGFVLPGLRIAGVLQRLAIGYLAAWAAKRWLGPRAQIVVATGLLLGYWAVMTRVVGPEGYPPSLDMETNLAAQVDRIALHGHLYHRTETWDPEGVLSTFPALATALLGLLAGEWLRSERRASFAKALGFLLGGLALVALGVLWGEAAPAWLLFPINKNLWSPSFVLLTGGLASALFGLTWWLVDVGGLRRGLSFFVAYGRNPIALYVGSEVLAGTLATIAWAGADGQAASLAERIHRTLFASWLPPAPASLAFALATVLLWYLVARAMDRRGVYLKV